MADVRLPYANALAMGLLPELALIRANLERAALALRSKPIEDVWDLMSSDLRAAYAFHEKLIRNNPLLTGPYWSDGNVAQRALVGAWLIDQNCPPWEFFTNIFGVTSSRGDASIVLWAAHEIDLGRTKELLDEYARMYLLDPDVMRATYVADPFAAHEDDEMMISKRSEFEDFRIQKNLHRANSLPFDYSEAYLWWSSGEAQLDFNRRVLEYARRHLNKLIVID